MEPDLMGGIPLDEETAEHAQGRRLPLGIRIPDKPGLFTRPTALVPDLDDGARSDAHGHTPGDQDVPGQKNMAGPSLILGDGTDEFKSVGCHRGHGIEAMEKRNCIRRVVSDSCMKEGGIDGPLRGTSRGTDSPPD